MAKHDVEARAREARDAGYSVADLVHEKQLAYGDASGIQYKLWQALLEQYREGDEYRMPVALMDHIPRLTRVFDRVCRIVSNPAADRMGEDPWRDLTGDGICGIVMPRTPSSWDMDADYRPYADRGQNARRFDEERDPGSEPLDPGSEPLTAEPQVLGEPAPGQT